MISLYSDHRIKEREGREARTYVCPLELYKICILFNSKRLFFAFSRGSVNASGVLREHPRLRYFSRGFSIPFFRLFRAPRLDRTRSGCVAICTKNIYQSCIYCHAFREKMFEYHITITLYTGTRPIYSKKAVFRNFFGCFGTCNYNAIVIQYTCTGERGRDPATIRSARQDYPERGSASPLLYKRINAAMIE